ncbi:tRNA (guanosine(46)-N7)-methyltransferase TrmB [Gammaproteobacteria bacterium]|nr:tRNA (guanosine(46)-N7)-methyltransferase TrmB [Gammaproteobacteria bacterium]
MTDHVSHHAFVRSFVRREGRMTPGQARALDVHWAQYGIDRPAEVPIDIASNFSKSGPLVIDIGFGNGESLLEMAKALPDHNFVGVDVYRPGIGACLLKLIETETPNVKLMHDDAQSLLRDCIADACFDRICIFFPDPWPKKRHHKRRMIQTEFVNLLAKRLKPGGELHLATDWEPYAEHMVDVLDACAELRRLAPNSPWAERPQYRPITRYQRRGERLGHRVRDLIYIRRSADISGTLSA